MQARMGLGIGLAILLSSGVLACGGTKDATDDLGGTTDGGSGDGSLTGDGGGGDGADDTPFTLGCNPACGDTQTCSVTKVCIDKGTCLADGDCTPGMKCDAATKKCVPGGGCGAIEAKAELVPPNMLIVLDRSCSMRSNVAGVPKWTHAVNAIKTLTTNYTGKIRFGLTLFPDTVGADCTQGAIPIVPGPMKETQIQTLLTKALVTTDVNYPDGPCVTNIDTGIKQAQDSAELKDTTRGNFVLLISDGAQSSGCSAAGGDLGTEMMIGNMAAIGIKTAVVGFGAGADAAQLDKFAVAGQMPSAGATKFYKAEDAASLAAALASIAAASLGCTYKLDAPPADATKIYVFFENVTEVTRDKTNGWEYDPATNSVVFYGTSCADIKAGKIKDIDIVLGCKQPTPT